MVRLALGLLLCVTTAANAADDYVLGPDSQVQEGVPRGKVTQHKWSASKVFPGTERNYWVYVPAQYDAAKPACVMIFQDGGGFQNEKGGYRVPVVFDNLIHKKEMPVTIAIFIDPGVIPAAGENQHPRYNRSYEYDLPSDQYARFLLEEILPEVGKSYNLSTKATDRAICGASSGGICAFTAAWERPEAFSRVVSFIGSFTNLRGGHSYASLIRKTEPKAIRVFLQDGTNDLDIYSGSWWVGNTDVAAALKFAGYEHQFVTGDGAHNAKHAGSVFPDALRYVWKDWPKLPEKPTFSSSAKDTRPTVMSILKPGEDWQLVSEGHRFTEGPAADMKGNIFFTDIPNNRIHKIDADGKASVFAENTGGANGLMFGPDGKLYACQGGKKQVVAYDRQGNETFVIDEIDCNDLVVTPKGTLYVTEPSQGRVWLVTPGQNKKIVATDIARPNGVIMTPDQGQLIVADTRAPFVYSFTIQPDGTLANKQPYMSLQMPYDKSDSGADGMTVDTEGRVYVTSHIGLQVFDQAGRVNAIICKPQHKWLSNACFGGKEMDQLYVTCGDKVYRRSTKAKGVHFFQSPVQTPKPRL
jgi:sugar lactone lactonase YvrE/enterochelin esterase-like enzyme